LDIINQFAHLKNSTMHDSSGSTGSKACLWVILALIGTSILASITFRALHGPSHSTRGNRLVTRDVIPGDELSEMSRESASMHTISRGEFERIDTGMTQNEVIRIVGSEGMEINQWEDDSTSGISWYWRGEKSSSAYATVAFINGRVHHKVNMGLK
jgi:hypothetical protein